MDVEKNTTLVSDSLDSFLVESFSELAGATVVLLGLGIGLYIIRGFFQYKLAQKLEHKHPWIAFFPIFAFFQWWQMGRKSCWWVGLVFVPGILDMITPWPIITSVFVIILLWLFVLTFQACLNIVKRCNGEPFLGGLLIFPVVRWWGMWGLASSQSIFHKNISKGKQWIILFGGAFVSIILTFVLWYMIGWMAFGSHFHPLLQYLSDPTVTPSGMLQDLLQANSS